MADPHLVQDADLLYTVQLLRNIGHVRLSIIQLEKLALTFIITARKFTNNLTYLVDTIDTKLCWQIGILESSQLTAGAVLFML